MDGGSRVIRTIWIAGLFLLLIAGLLATKMVSASVSMADDQQADTPAAFNRPPVPGVDTLTEADRIVITPAAAPDDTRVLPILSATVHAAPEKARAAARRLRSGMRARTATHAPAKRSAEPAKAAAAPCHQLDPIARFLASANLASGCRS